MAEQRRRSAAVSRTRVARHENNRGVGEAAARSAEARPDLTLIEGQFESALRAARVYVFSQDRTLQRTHIYSPRGVETVPAPDSEDVLAAKRRVLKTGQPEDVEAFYTLPEGGFSFSFHIDPTF